MSCEMAGVYYAKQNDLRDWGMLAPNKKKHKK